MPVKILLADKSITIQKVVEMLFSGKEYEVTCVSDGETALNEASRIVPGVVLADVDLPRVNGYDLAARFRETPALATVPVILMLSRDDQFDAGRGRKAGIIDNIAKPFESQELIGKVKKALAAPPPAAPAAAAPAKPAAPPPPKPTVPEPPKPAAPPPRPAEPAPPPPVPPKPAAVPESVFDIIQEAPAPAVDVSKRVPPQPARAASEFELEPEFEVEPETEAVPAQPEPMEVEVEPEIEAEVMPEEPVRTPSETEQIFGRRPEPATEAGPAASTFDFSEPFPSEGEGALPLGAKALEEMRQGLGLGSTGEEEPTGSETGHPDFVSFESLDDASRVSHDEYAPPVSPAAASEPPPVQATESSPAMPQRPPLVTDDMLQAACQDAVEKISKQVLERVAWEVIPDLAERLIRDEIERLKAGS
jgi:CheY-like chemotaxis protein